VDIKNLPFPGVGKTCQHILVTDLFLEQWIIPKGTKIKLAETNNFGIVLIGKTTKDKQGFIIPRTTFYY